MNTEKRVRRAEEDDQSEDDVFDMDKMQEKFVSFDSDDSDASDVSDNEEQEEDRVEAPDERKSVFNCGKVKKIDLWDFMCHERFEVDFSSGITCISGKNGSGKSAIVNALQICLGSNALSTGRARRLADFVKNNAQSAKIHVHLYNEGPRAFRPQELGPIVIVERTISRDGITKSRVLNGSTGRVFGDKKRDVEEICQHLGIHADNPCCVLDQERAKGFIKGSAHDKYQFFLSATDLETMVTEFERERKEKEKCKADFFKHKQLEVDLKTKLATATKEYENTKKVRDLDKTLQEVENKLAWALVADAKDDLDVAVNLTAQLDADLGRAREISASADAKSHQKVEEFNVLKNSIAEVAEDIKLSEQAATEAQKSFKEAQNAWKKLSGSKRQLEEDLAAANKLKKNTESKMALLVEKMSKSGGASVEALSRDKDQLDREIETLKAQQSDVTDLMEAREVLENKIEEVSNLLGQANGKLSYLKRRMDEARKQVETEEKALSTPVVSSTLKSYTVFDSQLPHIMEKINACRNFKKKPIFIGDHVKLRSAEFEVPVRNTIGNTIHGFITDSIFDQAELNRITGPKWTTFVRPFAEARYATKRPSAEFITFVDVLEIDNPNVFNLLVDIHRIEGLVLMNDAPDRIWQGTTAQATLPENVVAAFDAKGDSRTTKGGSRVFEANTKTGQMPYIPKVQSLAQSQGKIAELDPDYQLKQAKAKAEESESNYNKTKNEISVYENDKRLMEKERAELDGRISSHAARSSELTKQVNTLNKERERLSEQIKDLSSQADALRYDELTKMCEKHASMIRELESDIAKEDKLIQMAKEESLNPAEELYKQRRKRVETLEERYQEALAAMQQLEEEIKPLRQEVDEAKRRVQKSEALVDKAKSTVEEKKSVLMTKEEAALRCTNGERLEVKEDAAELRKRLKGLLNAREQEEARAKEGGETLDKRLLRVEGEYHRAKKNYETVKSDMEAVESRVKLLKKAMKNRKKLYARIREHTEKTTRNLFNILLKSKGQSGDVIFDHANKTLDIKWFRDIQAGTSTQADVSDGEDDGPTGQAFTDTKALSGGERSTATLCLLLALGKSVDVPFVVMDEFDVFMDAQARKIALTQLITAARQPVKGVRRQYVLISPQDFSTVKEDVDIKKLVIEPNKSQFGARAGERGPMDAFIR